MLTIRCTIHESCLAYLTPALSEYRAQVNKSFKIRVHLAKSDYRVISFMDSPDIKPVLQCFEKAYVPVNWVTDLDGTPIHKGFIRFSEKRGIDRKSWYSTEELFSADTICNIHVFEINDPRKAHEFLKDMKAEYVIPELTEEDVYRAEAYALSRKLGIETGTNLCTEIYDPFA